MLKNLCLPFALALSALGFAQDPWPMERHDRWGSGLASIGPSSLTPTPWVFKNIDFNTPVSGCPSIGSDGIGYYGDWVANKVYKLDTTTGDVLTYFQALNFVVCTPALSNGQIFFGTVSTSGEFFGVDTTGFDYNWFDELDYQVGSPIIAPDGSVINAFNTGIARLDPVYGGTTWQASGTPGGTPAFTRDDSKVLFANGTHLTALDYVTGLPDWDVVLNGTVQSPGVAANGTIVCGTSAGTVYALNPANGATLWKFTTLAQITSAPAFSPDGNSAYVGSYDYRLYSFNIADGHRNWTYTSSYWIVQAPSVGTDGSIYFSNYANDLYRINSDGTLAWTENLPGQTRGPISLGPDGTIYIGYTGNGNSGLLMISQQPLSLPVTSYSLYRGLLISGNLASLQAVDQNYLIVRNGPTLNTSEPPIQVTLTSQLSVAAPASLIINLTAGVDTPGLEQIVECYNTATDKWDRIDTRSATTSDASMSISVPDAGNYWNSSTQEIQYRVCYKQVGPTLISAWAARIDFAGLTVVPVFNP